MTLPPSAPDMRLDAMCGRPVEAGSRHCCHFRGRPYFFCGADCAARFEQRMARRQSVIGSARSALTGWAAWRARLLRAAGRVTGVWVEEHLAAECCHELLQLLQGLLQHGPPLQGLALYRHVVVARTAAALDEADEVLRRVDQSYASWPVDRDITFRDVVRYLLAWELWHGADGQQLVQAELKRVVDAHIPHQL
jgi:YHS domain-containing protein